MAFVYDPKTNENKQDQLKKARETQYKKLPSLSDANVMEVLNQGSGHLQSIKEAYGIPEPTFASLPSISEADKLNALRANPVRQPVAEAPTVKQTHWADPYTDTAIVAGQNLLSIGAGWAELTNQVNNLTPMGRGLNKLQNSLFGGTAADGVINVSRQANNWLDGHLSETFKEDRTKGQQDYTATIDKLAKEGFDKNSLMGQFLDWAGV